MFQAGICFTSLLNLQLTDRLFKFKHVNEEIWLRKWGRDLLDKKGNPDVKIVAV